jgi:hypothetical protein
MWSISVAENQLGTVRAQIGHLCPNGSLCPKRSIGHPDCGLLEGPSVEDRGGEAANFS